MCVDLLQLIKPSQTFSRIHGNSGVTDIRCYGDDVYSCGCNGRYCRFAVVNGNQLQLISTNRVSFINSANRCNVMYVLQLVVQPKLEYCIQAWRPYLCKDVELLEKVQRRASRLMFGDKSLGNYERLRKLGLTTLETRRLRDDIIEVLKIFKVFEDVTYSTYFPLSQSGLRGHSYKLYISSFRLDIRKFSFSVRVINIWNALPYSVLQCNTVNTFKCHLDLCLEN